MVISEAVFHTYYDPVTKSACAHMPTSGNAQTYHRFVNTTPKPSATKNSNGELVGPPLLLLGCVGVELAAAFVAVDDDIVKCCV